MNEEEIAYSGDDDGFVCAGGETGDNTSCEQSVVISGCHSNDRSDDTEN